MGNGCTQTRIEDQSYNTFVKQMHLSKLLAKQIHFRIKKTNYQDGKLLCDFCEELNHRIDECFLNRLHLSGHLYDIWRIHLLSNVVHDFKTRSETNKVPFLNEDELQIVEHIILCNLL